MLIMYGKLSDDNSTRLRLLIEATNLQRDIYVRRTIGEAAGSEFILRHLQNHSFINLF